MNPESAAPMSEEFIMAWQPTDMFSQRNQIAYMMAQKLLVTQGREIAALKAEIARLKGEQ